MVRKVGFGEDDAEPTSKTSIADQAMERFRKKAKIKAAREADREKSRRSNTGRILFLVLWLVLWIAMSGAVILAMAREGLNTNVSAPFPRHPTFHLVVAASCCTFDYFILRASSIRGRKT